MAHRPQFRAHPVAQLLHPYDLRSIRAGVEPLTEEAVKADAPLAELNHATLGEIEPMIYERTRKSRLEHREPPLVIGQIHEVRDRLFEPELAGVRADLEEDVGLRQA